LIVSNDLAVRAKVSGVSIVWEVAIRFKGRPVDGTRGQPSTVKDHQNRAASDYL
jgi:hypothetical protein